MFHNSIQPRYHDFVISIKKQIHTGESKATLSVNRQLVKLYFIIAKEIVSKQEEFGKRGGYSSAKELSLSPEPLYFISWKTRYGTLSFYQSHYRR